MDTTRFADSYTAVVRKIDPVTRRLTGLSVAELRSPNLPFLVASVQEQLAPDLGFEIEADGRPLNSVTVSRLLGFLPFESD